MRWRRSSASWCRALASSRPTCPRRPRFPPRARPEAAALLGTGIAADEDAMQAQAEGILALGAKAVLIKGGHGTGPHSVDFLFDGAQRSEERRVGKECRSRWSPYH